MSYFVRQDYLERHGAEELMQLTDRDGDGVEDAGVLDAAIADAEHEIDAYVGARYALPLTTVPLLLRRIARDLVRYALFDQRAPEEVRMRHQRAVKLLESIRSGAASLGLPQSAAPAGGDVGGDGGGLSLDTQPRRFGRGVVW